MANDFNNTPTQSGDFVIFAPEASRPQRLHVKPVGRDGEGPSDDFDSAVFIDFQPAAAHAFTFIASVGAGAVWLLPPDGKWDRVHWTAAMRAPGAARDRREASRVDLDAAAPAAWLSRLHRHLHRVVDSGLKTSGRTGELQVTHNGNTVNVVPPARAIELGVRGFIAVTHPVGESQLVVAEAAATAGPQPDMRHTPVDVAVVNGELQLEDFPAASAEQFGNMLWAELAVSGRR